MQNDEKVPLFEEDESFVDENHIAAFARALSWDESEELGAGDKGADKEENNETRKKRKCSKIASKNDWFSISSGGTVKKRLKEGKKAAERTASSMLANEFRSSASYVVLRWPILFFTLLWIVFLCIMYSMVRGYVAFLEYMITWVGERKKLRDQLRNSKSYEEWVENAIKLDKFLNLEKWSENHKFSYYNYKTIQLTVSRLRKFREEKLTDELMSCLLGCLKKNFAGIENKQLYSHRYYGTKILVGEFIEEVVQSLELIIDSPEIPLKTKRRFFSIVLKNFGHTALCLSGGACFAYTHFGIIKALLDNNLLPKIISGTSGGGLVAALACTRTDEELKKLLVPQLARKITACEDPWYVWLPRWWKTGARFDSISWARKSNFFTRGSLTFSEAYKRTGRILNISTVPSDPHSPVILCNNITSPNCIIWSSILASAAVPGILNPIVLLMKDPKNNENAIPFSLGDKWKDGSLRTDIPVEALNTYYNVNFSIVSQVNPHILLFFFAPKGTVGRPVSIPRRKTLKEKYAYLRGGFIAAALEQLLRLEITKWLKIIRSLDLLPHLMELDWLNIWLQKFSGSVTMWPRNSLKDFLFILSDPSEEQLGDMILKGERSVYPKLLFIKNRLTVERVIEKGRKATRLLSKKLKSTPNDGAAPPDPKAGYLFSTVDYEDDESDSTDEEVLFEPNNNISSSGSNIDPYFSKEVSDSYMTDEEDNDEEEN